MTRGTSELDDPARLERVQARVRELARNHQWVAGAIRSAFDDFLDLRARYVAEKAALDRRERDLARTLLAGGRLFDPICRDGQAHLVVRIEGLCPVELAAKLGKYSRGSRLPSKVERAGAIAALAALDRSDRYHAPGVPEKKLEAMAREYRAKIAAGTHVGSSWRIVVKQPEDWREPVEPGSLDREDLERLPDAEFRTIALYFLGGLADTGSVRPIVPKPKRTGDPVRDLAAYGAWRSRFPIREQDRQDEQPRLSVADLPSAVAEQMLHYLENWTADEGDSSNPGHSSPDNSQTQSSRFAWVRADTASKLSGLSADTIRKRANRDKWTTGKAGRMTTYRLRDLRTAWPDRTFRADKGGK